MPGKNERANGSMSYTRAAKIRISLAIVAVLIAVVATCLVIWPSWLGGFSARVIGASAGAAGTVPQNLVIIASTLSLTCLAVVSLMLPETTTIEDSMAQMTKNIADPNSLIAGIEKEVANNLDRIISLLKSHSETGRLYSASLENAGRNLIELTSPEQLRVAIGYLIAENNKMRKETGNLQSHLKESHEKIENLRENLEVAEETGMRDSLTALWNRGAFDKMMTMQVEAAARKNSPLCLILADIDHFKRINDNFGHLVGDEILRLVANTISRNVKGRDFVARFGGEEFALILPQTSLDNALKLATQIKNQLEIQKWVVSKRQEVIGTVTASFGVAQLRPSEDKVAFMGRADVKLYEAKESGRNRVVS
jgi:diguanylate cyclase